MKEALVDASNELALYAKEAINKKEKETRKGTKDMVHAARSQRESQMETADLGKKHEKKVCNWKSDVNNSRRTAEVVSRWEMERGSSDKPNRASGRSSPRTSSRRVVFSVAMNSTETYGQQVLRMAVT